jgi:4'-phosphopantetheinyl transferase
MAPDRNRSLSHSHGYAALALAPPFLAIGVDVEWLVPRDFLGMAEIAFAPVEVDCLASIGDPADRCAKFYELWTLKEAFAKALGLPLVDALQQCCFADAGRTGTIVVPTPQSWCAKVFAPRPQLRVAVACVADVTGSIRFPLETLEWPPARPTAWPIACSLASIGGGRGGAC